MSHVSVVVAHQETIPLCNGHRILCSMRGHAVWAGPLLASPRCKGRHRATSSWQSYWSYWPRTLCAQPTPIHTVLWVSDGEQRRLFPHWCCLICRIRVWGHFSPCGKGQFNWQREKWNLDACIRSLDSQTAKTISGSVICYRETHLCYHLR